MMERYMENDVTSKRHWSLEVNMLNKYIKCCNAKVLFKRLSQTSTLPYKDAYRRHSQSKNPERTSVREQVGNGVCLCGISTYSLPGNGPQKFLKQS